MQDATGGFGRRGSLAAARAEGPEAAAIDRVLNNEWKPSAAMPFATFVGESCCVIGAWSTIAGESG